MAITAPGRSQPISLTSVASSSDTQPAVGPPSVLCTKNAEPPAGNPVLVHAHHDGVLVLRDRQVLTLRGVERALGLGALLVCVVGGAVAVSVPPVVGPHLQVAQSAGWRRRGAKGPVQE